MKDIAEIVLLALGFAGAVSFGIFIGAWIVKKISDTAGPRF